jgi:hypothetical protein
MKKFASPRHSFSLLFPLMGLKPSRMPETGRVLPAENKKDRGELKSLVLDISRQAPDCHAYIPGQLPNKLTCHHCCDYCGFYLPAIRLSVIPGTQLRGGKTELKKHE